MKHPLLHRAAVRLTALAVSLLPHPFKKWGQAMAYEVEAIDDGGQALRFAIGCIGFALAEWLRFHFLPAPRLAAEVYTEGEANMIFSGNRNPNPRGIAATCGALATGLGLAWMAGAGAPVRYLAVNAGALMLGLAILTALVLTARSLMVTGGAVSVVLAAALLLTALVGTTAGGATRWVSIGGLFIQPSLILLPALVLCFARTRDVLSASGVALAALALALQPDRAMSGALLAGMIALAVMVPQRSVLFALMASGAGFAVSMIRADIQPAMPYVDRILFTAFDVHPAAGLAVTGGCGLLLLPAMLGAMRDPGNRAIHLSFGAVWLAIVAAAALGNYPTPLVGYGGSAIIGYLICLVALPRASESVAGPTEPSGEQPPAEGGRLRFGIHRARMA